MGQAATARGQAMVNILVCAFNKRIAEELNGRLGTGSDVTRQWTAQQEAIFAEVTNGLGNITVVARAGTGKTTVIIEAVNRIRNAKAQAMTLHALGYRAVLTYWTGIRPENNPKVSRADMLAEKVCGPIAPDAIKRLVSKLHTKGREINPLARTVGDLTDILYNFECEPDDTWQSAGYDARYVEVKALAAMELAATVRPANIDFADMIFLPVRNGWLQKQFDMVIVDEAQDMTVAQLLIAQGVCKGRLVVVGDDRQAIYGFRGADSGSLARLTAELKSTVLPLTVTYRCGQSIVALAAQLVPDFQAAPTNAQGTIENILDSQLVTMADAGDFILSRLNAPLVGTAMSLLRNGKRARVAGRDIGAGLKALIRKLARNARTVEQLLEKLSIWEAREAAKFLAADREAQADAVHDKAATLITIAEGVDSIEDIEVRIDALFTDDGLGQAGVITCSSVHRAKGLEASRVFILDFTLYTRGRNAEEENIEYVAITRAKNTLVRVAKGATV